MTPYEQVAGLVNQIRNARFGEMVKHNEVLITSSLWRDFTTPSGTHFQFHRCEFDYFLAAQEVDALTLRYAYLHAGAATQLLALADITGKGTPPVNGDRRARKVVADLYANDPGGAGGRIRAAEPVVTERTAKLAANVSLRKAYAAGKPVPPRARPNGQQWTVRWSDPELSVADAIAVKLLEDRTLASAVYRRLYGMLRPKQHATKRK
jgi:hypothetical protein